MGVHLGASRGLHQDSNRVIRLWMMMMMLIAFEGLDG